MPGVCVGANPVVCGALDICHLAGTCDSNSGICSNPVAPPVVDVPDDSFVAGGAFSSSRFKLHRGLARIGTNNITDPAFFSDAGFTNSINPFSPLVTSLALQGARALSLSLPNTATTQELFNAAAALGGKGWDHSGLVRVLEHLAGHPVAQ